MLPALAHLVRYKLAVMFVMTSSNGDIFRVTGLLWGEFTGPRWIPRAKASDVELWCILWVVPEQTAKQTLETIWDDIVLIMTSLLCFRLYIRNASPWKTISVRWLKFHWISVLRIEMITVGIRSGDKPFTEPMATRFTHVGVIRPQLL